MLGVHVHSVSMRETMNLMEAMLDTKDVQQVMPVNPELVMIARRNSEFRNVLNSASLALPDGAGVLWASRLLGGNTPERVSGIDAVLQFMSVAVRHKARVFLLGAAPGVAEAAADRLRTLTPGLLIAGTFSGSPAPEEEDELCGRINACNTDILLIAYGAPRQELWLARNAAKLKIRIGMCVGGSFDFLAGVSRRAPRWIRRSGLEWLFRLLQEPSRWRRMLALPQFALLVVAELIHVSLSGNHERTGLLEEGNRQRKR